MKFPHHLLVSHCSLLFDCLNDFFECFSEFLLFTILIFVNDESEGRMRMGFERWFWQLCAIFCEKILKFRGFSRYFFIMFQNLQKKCKNSEGIQKIVKNQTITRIILKVEKIYNYCKNFKYKFKKFRNFRKNFIILLNLKQTLKVL